MDFSTLESEEFEGMVINPYALNIRGEWVSGHTSIDFLNENFGQYSTAEDMKNATESEGLELYFDYLKSEGILN